MNNRTAYLDNVAGILIIHMIFTYHIAYACSLYDNACIKSINDVLFFFMAWFLFKGGMTYKNTPAMDMCKKSAKRLLVPYACFCLIGIFIDFALKFFSSNFSGLISFIKDEAYVFLTTSIVWSTGASWYLLTLFLVRNLYNYISGKISDWQIALLCLLASFALTFVNDVIPCYVSNLFHGMTLFSFGNLLKETTFNKFLLLVSVCIFALVFFFPSKIDFRDNSVICGHYMMAVAYEIAGCIIINNVFFRFFDREIILLTYIGKNSMVFYLVHYPVMYVTIHVLSQCIYTRGDMMVMFTITLLIVTAALVFADRIFRHDKLRFIIGG